MILTLLRGLAAFLIPHFFGWLDTRALIIPQEKLPAIAGALGTTPENLRAQNQALADEGTNFATKYLEEHFKI